MEDKQNKKLKQKEDDRGEWSNSVEFILSCLGYAVGLGNVWRFPYLCFENGGGAFLIPYVIMLTFVGIPVFLIELSAGQYARGGPLTVWSSVAPIFKGLGIGMMIISFIGNIQYNMIIAWSLYYMFASWQKVLPWSRCDHEYNTAYCYSLEEELECQKNDSDAVWFNQTCYNSTYLDSVDNDTRADLTNKISKRVSASEEYFNYAMLNRNPTIDETGEVQWQLVLVLLLAWVICYLCVIKGIRSAGKVVYFTATFPYLILLILLIRGVLLDGAEEGIKFYIIPDWDKLLTAKIWVDAAGQIFFTLSVGMGGLMTFASYNKFHNNVYRDTLIVTIGNCLTSLFAGFAIFSVLGYLAHILNKEVPDVAKSGSGLAFVAYPEVVLWLEPPQLWSTLFFLMLITLGLDSQFAGIENIMTAIVDLFPRLRRYKHWVALVLCISMFLLGLTMCTQAGVYWVDLMSYYSSGWSLVLIGMCEVMIFSWCYTASRLLEDIESMVGFRLYRHWWFCWTFISPLLLVAILIFNFIDFTPLKYGDYVLADWAQTLGWMMALSSVTMIPVFAIVQIVLEYRKRASGDLQPATFTTILKTLTKPTERWTENHERNTKFTNDRAIDSKQKDNLEDQQGIFTLSNDKPLFESLSGHIYDNEIFTSRL